VVFDDIFHDDPIEGDVPSREHLLIDQLRPHEVIEGVLGVWLNFGEDVLVGLFPELTDIVEVFADGLQVGLVDRYGFKGGLLVLWGAVEIGFVFVLAVVDLRLLR
jgi:hypothetical protein